ncbi:hypothetical protein [Gimibacter soli]|uniref:DUF3800 domain-containing protein n=1 Tax=Gimibacter soli TaxID=3024400 RepID=A0AAE9XPX9_9PROT|nr:hypothetical protein [Gimibacter soli]WCL54094.1 hypothetical protein PH603_16265 [Gimibacter soli]
MKLAYLGEAKTGGEPWAVAVLVIADPDRHWPAVDKAFVQIRKAHLMPKDRATCTFNPKEIFHGSGTFARDRYEFETRLALLEALTSLPTALGLKLFVAAVPAENCTQEDARTLVLEAYETEEAVALVTDTESSLKASPIGPPLMADRATSPLLQLADIVAFIAKRAAAEKEDTMELYERLLPAFA